MKFMATYILFFGHCSHNQECLEQVSRFSFDLQRFSGEKTEEATPKKRSEARDKGQVAKSQDLNSACVVMMAFVLLNNLGRNLYAEMSQFMILMYTNISSALTVEYVMKLLLEIIVVFLKTSFPIMLVIMLVGLVINLYQVGWHFTLSPLMPDIMKLNPITGIGRMFSMRSLVELFKSLLKIVVVGYFVYKFFQQEIMQLPKLMYMDLTAFMSYMGGMVYALAMRICEVLLVMGLLDYMYQKWEVNKSLKMSKQEVKDEMKQAEGDPSIKGKIRQKQRAMAMQRMMQEVPKADVIITNPTHFAVALKYEEGMAAPQVIAKGQDLLAQKIKQIARENKVVIVENRVLARALYSSAEVGDMVPPELYKSVAEVLAYVYRLKKKIS